MDSAAPDGQRPWQHGQLRRPAARAGQHGLQAWIRCRFGRQLDARRCHPATARRTGLRYPAHPVAVPVAIEHSAGLARHRPDTQHIKVVKVERRVQAHVFVADVAPAQHGHPVVHNHLLVVHATVQALKLDGPLGHPPGPIALAPGIEHADLDVGVAVDAGQHRVAQLRAGHVVQHGVEVVEQHAHPDAAVRRRNHPRHQQLACGVAEPDIVLEVQRVGCAVNQHQAPFQSVQIAFQQPETGCIGTVRRANGLLQGHELTRPLHRHGLLDGRLRCGWRRGTPRQRQNEGDRAGGQPRAGGISRRVHGSMAWDEPSS